MAFCTTIKQGFKKSENNNQDAHIIYFLQDLLIDTKVKVVNEDVSTLAINSQEELLRCHFRLGYL